MRLDIRELTPHFPDFRVAVVVAEEMVIPESRPSGLETEIARREAAIRERWGGHELAEVPGVLAWRRAYKAFGIKSTRYRSAVERLVKNTLAERPLVAVNGFVDAYNAVSLAHVLPAGADDLDRLVGDLAFRFARDGDGFVDMAGGGGGEGPVEDPPKPGEIVYADAEKVLCRRWNWRQDARSLVGTGTRRAVVTIQWLGHGELEAAAADLVDLLGRFCAAKTKVTFADATRPVVEIGPTADR
jgi:DNA/RNA-binding domain of Phe-tRNA-synthetase-like protein